MKLPNSETREEDESQVATGVNMKRQYLIALLIVVLVLGLSASSVSGLLTGLAGHWAASLVGVLEAKGIVSGDEFGRYNPDAPLTRAQLAKMFAVGLGFEQEARLLARYPSRFDDIPSWHWAGGYIESLAEIGLAEGYPGGGFGPNDPVTRAQMAVMLIRASGLSESARLMKFERTSYRDDAEIPSWARGEVLLATQKGLVNGFADGAFRPLQPVTRAEGAAVLFRLLDLRGMAFHLSGTLMRFDVQTRTGSLRDELGQERSFTMAQGAQVVRGGVQVSILAVRPLDQVWVVLDDDGLGRFMEARYKDVLAERIQIAGSEAVLTLKEGLRVLPVQPNALVFLNGRTSTLQAVSDKGPAYVVMDVTSGEIRLIDTIDTPIAGEFIGLRESDQTIVLLVGERSAEYAPDADAKVFLNGMKVSVSELAPGDRIRMAVNAQGRVTYVQAER